MILRMMKIHVRYEHGASGSSTSPSSTGQWAQGCQTADVFVQHLMPCNAMFLIKSQATVLPDQGSLVFEGLGVWALAEGFGDSA